MEALTRWRLARYPRGRRRRGFEQLAATMGQRRWIRFLVTHPEMLRARPTKAGSLRLGRSDKGTVQLPTQMRKIRQVIVLSENSDSFGPAV
jgi:hypothetical protein